MTADSEDTQEILFFNKARSFRPPPITSSPKPSSSLHPNSLSQPKATPHSIDDPFSDAIYDDVSFDSGKSALDILSMPGHRKSPNRSKSPYSNNKNNSFEYIDTSFDDDEYKQLYGHTNDKTDIKSPNASTQLRPSSRNGHNEPSMGDDALNMQPSGRNSPIGNYAMGMEGQNSHTKAPYKAPTYTIPTKGTKRIEKDAMYKDFMKRIERMERREFKFMLEDKLYTLNGDDTFEFLYKQAELIKAMDGSNKSMTSRSNYPWSAHGVAKDDEDVLDYDDDGIMDYERELNDSLSVRRNKRTRRAFSDSMDDDLFILKAIPITIEDDDSKQKDNHSEQKDNHSKNDDSTGDKEHEDSKNDDSTGVKEDKDRESTTGKAVVATDVSQENSIVNDVQVENTPMTDSTAIQSVRDNDEALHGKDATVHNITHNPTNSTNGVAYNSTTHDTTPSINDTSACVNDSTVIVNDATAPSNIVSPTPSIQSISKDLISATSKLYHTIPSSPSPQTKTKRKTKNSKDNTMITLNELSKVGKTAGLQQGVIYKVIIEPLYPKNQDSTPIEVDDDHDNDDVKVIGSTKESDDSTIMIVDETNQQTELLSLSEPTSESTSEPMEQTSTKRRRSSVSVTTGSSVALPMV